MPHRYNSEPTGPVPASGERRSIRIASGSPFRGEQSGGQLPSGWWLLPAVILGAVAWIFLLRWLF